MTPAMKVLSSALRKRRKTLGLSQIQLGRFAGCGPDFIYDLEQGKPTLRLDKVLAVLSILGLQLTLGPGKSGVEIDERLR
jgi:y4mF family transcriptional regulator